MPSRCLPMLGLTAGVLVVACTSAHPALELEPPEDDATALVDEPVVPLQEPRPPQIDAGDELPDDRCVVTEGPRDVVPVDDPQDPAGGRLLTERADGTVVGLPLEHTSFDTIVVGRWPRPP